MSRLRNACATEVTLRQPGFSASMTAMGAKRTFFRDPECQRCGQPGQQHGRRFPSLRLEQPQLMRLRLVSGFFGDSIQQIHSLRASGVMSCQVASASG